MPSRRLLHLTVDSLSCTVFSNEKVPGTDGILDLYNSHDLEYSLSLARCFTLFDTRSITWIYDAAVLMLWFLSLRMRTQRYHWSFHKSWREGLGLQDDALEGFCTTSSRRVD